VVYVPEQHVSVSPIHTYMVKVVELDVQYRQRVHVQQLHTYMYGQVISPPPGLSALTIGDADFDGHLAPSSSVIPFGELTLLRIGESELNLPPIFCFREKSLLLTC